MSSIESDLRIDAANLDLEWAVLPDLYFRYSRELDSLDMSIKSLNLNLDKEYSSNDAEIRKEPDCYLQEGEKLTETKIKSIILKQDWYHRSKRKIIEVEKKKRIVLSALEAIKMKQTAMKHMTNLFATERFCIPTDKQMEVYDRKYKQIESDDILSKVRDRLNKNREERRKLKNA